jgi:hypothetical protein
METRFTIPRLSTPSGISLYVYRQERSLPFRDSFCPVYTICVMVQKHFIFLNEWIYISHDSQNKQGLFS